jgi:hypothetical protein
MFNADKSSKRDTPSPDDVSIVLRSDVIAGNNRPLGGAGEAAKWIPLISLYSGTRLGEIGQLLVPSSAYLLTGQEHGRTIPLAEVRSLSHIRPGRVERSPCQPAVRSLKCATYGFLTC